jgi:ankyrin repeat protein
MSRKLDPGANLESLRKHANLLLAHGADPNFRNGEGKLPDQVAVKRGLDEAAELIRAARG